MSGSISEVMISARDVYRNCVRVLLAADIEMEERGFSRYYNWDQILDSDPLEKMWRKTKALSSASVDTLLSGYLFHQYFEPDHDKHDVVTICTAPWRRVKSASFRPACCATRLQSKETPNEIYWLGTIPIWEEQNAVDGMVHDFSARSQVLWPEYAEVFGKLIAEGQSIKAISIPLEEVTSSDVISARLLKSLLGT